MTNWYKNFKTLVESHLTEDDDFDGTREFFTYAIDITRHMKAEWMQSNKIAKAFEIVLVCKDEATHVASMTASSYYITLGYRLIPEYTVSTEEQREHIDDLENDLKAEDNEGHGYTSFIEYDKQPKNRVSELVAFHQENDSEEAHKATWEEAEEYFNGNDHTPSIAHYLSEGVESALDVPATKAKIIDSNPENATDLLNALDAKEYGEIPSQYRCYLDHDVISEQAAPDQFADGDDVHLGFGAKGGTGFSGKLDRIENGQAFITNAQGKQFKGPASFLSKGQGADMTGKAVGATGAVSSVGSSASNTTQKPSNMTPANMKKPVPPNMQKLPEGEEGLSDERINRLEKDWGTIAQEPVSVFYIKGLVYCTGSELACLRLYYKYRRTESARVSYSKNLESWTFGFDMK